MASIEYLAKVCNMNILDAKTTSMDGGSIVVCLSKKPQRFNINSKSVYSLLEYENISGFRNTTKIIEKFDSLMDSVALTRELILEVERKIVSYCWIWCRSKRPEHAKYIRIISRYDSVRR